MLSFLFQPNVAIDPISSLLQSIYLSCANVTRENYDFSFKTTCVNPENLESTKNFYLERRNPGFIASNAI